MDILEKLHEMEEANPEFSILMAGCTWLAAVVGIILLLVLWNKLSPLLWNLPDFEDIERFITKPKFRRSGANKLEWKIETGDFTMQTVEDLVGCLSQKNQISAERAGQFYNVNANGKGPKGWKPVTVLGKSAKKLNKWIWGPMDATYDPIPIRGFGLFLFPVFILFYLSNLLDYVAVSSFADKVVPILDQYVPFIRVILDLNGNGLLAGAFNVVGALTLLTFAYIAIQSASLRPQINLEVVALFVLLVVRHIKNPYGGSTVEAQDLAIYEALAIALYIDLILFSISSMLANSPRICDLRDLIHNLAKFREDNRFSLSSNELRSVDILLSYYAHIPAKTADEWDEYVTNVENRRSEEEREKQQQRAQAAAEREARRNQEASSGETGSWRDHKDFMGNYKLDVLPDSLTDSEGTGWNVIYRDDLYVDYVDISTGKHIIITQLDGMRSHPEFGEYVTDAGTFRGEWK